MRQEVYMKKSLLILCLAILAPTLSHARLAQVGLDVIVPYEYSPNSGRLATLVGPRGEVFINEYSSVTFSALWGAEDKGFNDKPFYVVPGLAFYIPSPILNPYLRLNLPILVNDEKNWGFQGAAGLWWNIIAGLGLEYSVDITRYFDQGETVVDWFHLGAVFTF